MIETGLIRQLDKYCQVSQVLPWGCVQLVDSVRVTPLHPLLAGARTPVPVVQLWLCSLYTLCLTVSTS